MDFQHNLDCYQFTVVARVLDCLPKEDKPDFRS